MLRPGPKIQLTSNPEVNKGHDIPRYHGGSDPDRVHEGRHGFYTQSVSQNFKPVHKNLVLKYVSGEIVLDRTSHKYIFINQGYKMINNKLKLVTNTFNNSKVLKL